LARTTQALHALARNELEAPLPMPLANDEIAAVIGAVSTLQVQTRQREALEDERDDLIERLRDMSNTDFLTGLPNRRAFLTAAEADLAQAGRHGFGVVAILLDIDKFKQFNDELGHAAGDQALTEVAQTVRRSLRLGDLVARYGGEEFVLLLSHCDRHRGLRFAERLRLAIAAAPIVTPSGVLMHVTASLGVADSERHGLGLEALLSRADAAMYRAKDEGRNRVVLADGAESDEWEPGEQQADGRQAPGESVASA
jgi:diguanylate cyclase (GGDEF)-like protein